MYKSLYVVALLLPFCTALANDKAIPVEAAEVIRTVHRAAAAKDFDALKRSMVDEFVWSFGETGNADRALNAWRTDRAYLRNLIRVTALPCENREDLVECPRRAGTGYRAGFKKTGMSWQMIYFVAGD